MRQFLFFTYSSTQKIFPFLNNIVITPMNINNIGKSNHKPMSKTGVKKSFKVNPNAATFPHPQPTDDFHDDSSLRSLSSSFSGFSASVSRFDNLRSQDISILKVLIYVCVSL